MAGRAFLALDGWMGHVSRLESFETLASAASVHNGRGCHWMDGWWSWYYGRERDAQWENVIDKILSSSAVGS